MTILITGGNGFIGRSLAKSLGDYSPIVVNRCLCNLTDRAEVDRFFENRFFDVVIHAAIVGGNRLVQDDSSVLDQNLMMYYNILANRSRFRKFINFDSGASEYQISKPYGLSKHVIARSVLEKPGFYSIRIFAVFGKDELERRFIKTNIKKYAAKEPMEIFQNKQMDFFYMDDLVTLVRYYLENEDPPKTIDCVYPESFTLLDISDMINNLASHKVDVVVLKDGMGEKYTGVYQSLPVDFIGLRSGIKITGYSLGV